MSAFFEFVRVISDFIWSYILMFVLVGVGVYLTVLLRFPQFTRVHVALKKMIADIRANAPVEPGRMTPFQSLATAVAAQVGTGNIVGVASAIAAGGPGAAFWMLLSAFFGMSTIFGEAVLAQVYRHKTPQGDFVGGPAYYIRNGLGSKFLSTWFAVFCIIALGVVGLMVQSNSIVNSLNSAFNFPPVWATVALVALVGVILTGGMDRIAAFSEKVVPVMAGIYILGSLIIIIMNIGMLIPALTSIVVGAFTPQAISGGVLGITIQQALRFGIARGLFTNEAGLGSTPHSHAVADTDHPAEQGFVAMIGVFICTFLICTSTAMVNLVSGSYDYAMPAVEMQKGAGLMTQNAFASGFGGFGAIFLSISLTAFAFTTIVGWFFFAESNIKLLFNDNRIVVRAYKVLAMAFIVIGPLIQGDDIWLLSDLATGLMALPNIIALILLSKEVKWLLNDYDRCVAAGKLQWPDLETKPWKKKKNK